MYKTAAYRNLIFACVQYSKYCTCILLRKNKQTNIHTHPCITFNNLTQFSHTQLGALTVLRKLVRLQHAYVCMVHAFCLFSANWPLMSPAHLHIEFPLERLNAVRPPLYRYWCLFTLPCHGWWNFSFTPFVFSSHNILNASLKKCGEGRQQTNM